MNKNSYIFSKLYYSSGKIFNKMIRGVAKKKGYKLNEWGLFKKDKIIKIESEKELFKLLELYFVKFENRR
jgi:DNA polymerase (family 10)